MAPGTGVSPSSTPSGFPRICARVSACPSRSSPTRWSGDAGRRASTRCPQAEAQPLARQALRYLYRILFLLYAEASPELEVLPVGAGEYEQGYGLDRLRELTLVELASPRATDGTHLYDSLALLFRPGRPGARAAAGRGWRPARPGLPQPAGRPVPAQSDEPHRRGGHRQRGRAAGPASPAAQQGVPRQGPWLHLLRRARDQPARRRVRGPDVLHRLLRRDRPVRGGQGRRLHRRVPGSSRSSGPKALPSRTSSASRTRPPASTRRSCTSGALSSSGWRAGNASSRPPITRRRC